MPKLCEEETRRAKEPPAPNLKFEALELALKQQDPGDLRRPPRRRYDDGPAFSAKEFELKPMLTLATEGYLMADAIVGAKVPVIVHPTMQRAVLAGDVQRPISATPAFLADRKIPIGDRHRLRGLCSQDSACSVSRRPWRWSTAWASTAP